MEQDIYLYPGSQSEAHRLGEAALWDASFHANVSCARDIEAVIRVYGDGRSALKPEASQMVLKRWGFKRTNFVLANTIERLGPYKEQLSAENQEWQKKAYVPPDDAHNRYFEVDTALAYTVLEVDCYEEVPCNEKDCAHHRWRDPAPDGGRHSSAPVEAEQKGQIGPGVMPGLSDPT